MMKWQEDLTNVMHVVMTLYVPRGPALVLESPGKTSDGKIHDTSSLIRLQQQAFSNWFNTLNKYLTYQRNLFLSNSLKNKTSL